MKKVVGALSACLSISLAHAIEAEFNEAFLHQSSGQSKIDLERFRYGNPISAGDYLADIYVNNEFRGQMLLKFIEVTKDPMQGLCWSPQLLEILDVQPQAVLQEPSDGQCISAINATDQLSFNFDVSTHRLDVSIPQALMVIYPRGYIPRSRWQSGVPATFLRYQFNGYHNDANNNDSQNQFLGLQFGANLGAWSLRHQGSMSWNNHQKSDYRRYQTYIQRDIDQINGRLRIGDLTTQSPLLDNFNIRGVSLVSDVRMLPSSQTGYAPEIRGIAKSNARVRVLQNDNIIYETSVGAGPFIISDLYALSSSLGDLTVEVLESDGSKNLFDVPFFVASNMLRPRQFRYHGAMGYYRSQNQIGDKPLLHGSVQYGVNNQFTAQAGIIAHQDYQSATVGGIWSSKLGALSADMQTSHLKSGQKAVTANQVDFGYSRYFDSSKTYLSADMVHFFSKHYLEPTRVFLSQDNAINEQSLKNQYRLSLSQRLTDKLGSVYLSGVLNDYWRGKDYYSYQVGYSNFYKKFQYRFGLSRSYNVTKDKPENAFFVNLSIPFLDVGTKDSRVSISSNYQHTPQGDYSQLSFSQSFGERNQYDYTVAVDKQDYQKPSIFGSVNASLPVARVGASVSQHNNDKQYTYSINGAIIAYKHGVILNNDISDTFAIIRAKNAQGTPIVNSSGSTIDRWGNGVASYLSPYRLNHVAIDVQGLPDDVEISATGKELVPRANTTNLIEFETQSGQSVIFDIERQDGVPPLTTPAYDEQNNIVGYVLQDGRLLARLNNTKGTIKLNWQDNGEKQCMFDYELNTQDKQPIQIYPIRC